jgi:MFS family permease
MIGLIGGSYGLMQLIFRIPIGLFSDVMQKRKPSVVLGISFVALSGLCFMLFDTPMGLLAARSFAGIAASFWAVFAVMFASYFKDQVRGIGILSAFHSAGMVIATLTGGVISQSIGETAPFAFTAVMGIIGIAISLMLKEKMDVARSVKVKELLDIRKEKPVLLFSVLGVLLQFVSFGTAYVFTPLVAKNLGAGDAELGVLTFLFTLPGVFASLFIGTKLFRRIGFKKALGISFILMAVTCIPIVLVKSMSMLFVIQFIAGFGRGICFTGLLSLVVSSVPKERKATATGFYQAVYALGMFLGPIFTGLFGDETSLIIPYTVMALVSAAAAAATFVFYNKLCEKPKPVQSESVPSEV